MAIIYSIHENDEYIRYDTIILPISLNKKEKVLNIHGVPYKSLGKNWIPLIEKDSIREIPIKNRNSININTYNLFGTYRDIQVMVYLDNGNMYEKRFNVHITDYSMDVNFDEEINGIIVLVRNISYNLNIKNVYFDFEKRFDKTNFTGASESTIMIKNDYIHVDILKSLIVFKKDLEIEGDIDITEDILIKRHKSKTFNTHGENKIFYYPVFNVLNDYPVNDVYASKLCGHDITSFALLGHKHPNYMNREHDYDLEAHPYLHKLMNDMTFIKAPKIIKDNTLITLKPYETVKPFIGKHTHTNWLVSRDKMCLDKILDFEISENISKSKPILTYKTTIDDIFEKVYDGYNQDYDEIGSAFAIDKKYFVIYAKKQDDTKPSLHIYSRKTNKLILEKSVYCELNNVETIYDLSIAIKDNIVVVGIANSNNLFVYNIENDMYNCIKLENSSMDKGISLHMTKDFLYVGNSSMNYTFYNDHDNELIDAGGILKFHISRLFSYNPPRKLILPCDINNGTMFGHSVSANNTHFAVGAPGVITNNVKGGAVYLIDKNNENNETKIVSSSLNDNDKFGYKIILTDNVLVVSAPNKDNGTLFVYNIFGGEERVIKAPSGSEKFGNVFTVTENNILVGDEKNSTIYVYDIETLKFSKLASPALGLGENISLIGFGLASFENSLLVSSIIENPNNESKIHIFLYEDTVLKPNALDTINELDLSHYLQTTDNVYLSVSVNSNGFSSPMITEKLEISPFIVPPVLDIDKDYNNVLNNATIYSSEYKAVGMDEPHLQTKWIITTLKNDTVWKCLVDVDKTYNGEISIPSGILDELTEYYIECIYYSKNYSNSTKIKVKTAMFLPIHLTQKISLPFFVMGMVGKMGSIQISDDSNVIIVQSFMAGLHSNDQSTVYGEVAIYRRIKSQYILEKQIKGVQATSSNNSQSSLDSYDGVIGYIGCLSNDGSHFITGTYTKFLVYKYENSDWVLKQTIERNLGGFPRNEVMNINCKISYNGDKIVLVEVYNDRTRNSLIRVFDKVDNIYIETFSDLHPQAGFVSSMSPNGEYIAIHSQGPENEQIFYIKNGNTYDKVLNTTTPLTYSSKIFNDGEFFDGEKANEIIIMSKKGSNWQEKDRIVFGDLYSEFGRNELFSTDVSQKKRLILTNTMIMTGDNYQFRFINSLFSDNTGSWDEIARDFFNPDEMCWVGLVSAISGDGTTIVMTSQDKDTFGMNTLSDNPPKTNLLIFK